MKEQHESGRADRPATGDPGSGLGATGLDDAAIGAMVRDASDRWVVPPQRLGRPTWRDLVERRSPRRLPAGDPAGAAAWQAPPAGHSSRRLSLPSSRSGSRPRGRRPRSRVPGPVQVRAPRPARPSAARGSRRRRPAPRPPADRRSARAHGGGSRGIGGETPKPSGAAPTARVVPSPSPTPLPEHLVNGPPLSEPSVLVGADASYRMLDTTTGQLGSPVADRTSALTRIWRLADGSYLCACMTRTRVVDSSAVVREGVSVTIKRLDAAGNLTALATGPSYLAPNASPATPDSVAPVDVSAAVSPDARWLYLGSSVLADGVWHVALDVVDVADGHVIQGLPMEGVTASAGAGTTRFALAPTVNVSPDGGHVAVLTTTVTDPIGFISTSRTLRATDELRRAPPRCRCSTRCRGAAVPGIAPAPPKASRRNDIYYVLCSGTTTTLHRFGLDGKLIGSTDLDVSNATYPVTPVLGLRHGDPVHVGPVQAAADGDRSPHGAGLGQPRGARSDGRRRRTPWEDSAEPLVDGSPRPRPPRSR